MSEASCDRRWEVDALREGRLGPKDAEAFDRHARGCPICSSAVAQSGELDSWLKQASSHEPSTIELRRARMRILRTVGSDSERAVKPNRIRFVLAAALLLIAGGGVALKRHATRPATIAISSSSAPISSLVTPSVAPDFMASVQATSGARWTQSRDGQTEHVALDEGGLHIRVRQHDANLHFIVDLPDCTIEDRGTTFDVEAHDDHTTRVSVSEGLVAIHFPGASDVVLNAGATWPTPSTPALTTTSANAHAAPRASTIATDDGSTQYAAAVSLLRDRKYAEAAAAFDAYLRAHSREPDAEDASYLEAVALAQSGDTQAASRAAERHLAIYPASFHRKEASLLIARIARDHGDCAKARKTLAPWLGSPPDPEATATVRSCADP
jgi:ferric-dicitrate binding protein FerR (iron transport regulator)